MIGVAAIIAVGIILRGQLKGGGDEPLVACQANSDVVSHDKKLIFTLALNGKRKEAAQYDLDSVTIADNGIALNSNVESAKLIGPFHAGLVDTAMVVKNTIEITPVKDVREKMTQEVKLRVLAALRDKKRNTITRTSALCEATIVHTLPPAAPPAPVAVPKPKPPILIKDESGNWVEPKKPATTESKTGLTKTPSFTTKFQKYITDNVTQLSVVVKPEDLAGKTIAGIEIATAARGYTLPPVYHADMKLNDGNWYNADWKCSDVGEAFRCLGTNALEAGKYSVVALNFQGLIDSPPAFLNAKLLAPDGSIAVGIDIPFVAGE